MITIPKLKYQDSGNFFLLAGPCVIESEEVVDTTAKELKRICDLLRIPLILKGSFKKANRSKVDSFTGIGDIKALNILKSVGERYDLPTVTDIHETSDAALAAPYVDILQIPAFLCRQTDLLGAAAKTGKVVNVKKGQFLSGESMRFAAQKVVDAGNDKVMLTERGNSFGYQDLVVDYRNLIAMKKTGYPVVLDITHSLQQPNQTSGVTGGNPELIETIARAGIAVGVDGIFMETHPDPTNAKSDGANMLPLQKAEQLLSRLVRLRQTVNAL